MEDTYLEEAIRALNHANEYDHNGVIEINTDDNDTLVITGNNGGLIRFASALLVSVKMKTETGLEHDNGVMVDHTEISEIIIRPKEYEPALPVVLTWKDKFISWGFGLFLVYCLLIAIGSILGGLYAVCIWIYHSIHH